MQRTTQGESTDRCHIIFQVKWKTMAAWHVRQNAAKKSDADSMHGAGQYNCEWDIYTQVCSY